LKIFLEGIEQEETERTEILIFFLRYLCLLLLDPWVAGLRIANQGIEQEETERTEILNFSLLPLFSPVKSLSEVCPGKNQPTDSIGDFHFVKVYQQPDRNVEQFHVAQQLCFVNGQDFFDGFGLHEHASFNQHIKT
jgi:hypothetical protein